MGTSALAILFSVTLVLLIATLTVVIIVCYFKVCSRDQAPPITPGLPSTTLVEPNVSQPVWNYQLDPSRLCDSPPVIGRLSKTSWDNNSTPELRLNNNAVEEYSPSELRPTNGREIYSPPEITSLL